MPQSICASMDWVPRIVHLGVPFCSWVNEASYNTKKQGTKTKQHPYLWLNFCLH